MKNSIIIKHSRLLGETNFELFLNGKSIDDVRAYAITGAYDDITEVTITLLAGEIKMLIEGNSTKGLQSTLRKFTIRCKGFLRRMRIKIY